MRNAIDIIQRGIDEGLHLGAQLFVWRDGTTLFDDGIGEASVGVPMSRDSINLWYSSVKPVMPVALAQLRERKLLDYDDAIAKFVPEFSAHDKGGITIRHCLTHTAGIRQWPNLPLSTPWNEIVAKLCAMRVEPHWPVGEKAGYHPRTTWFMLAEVIRRITDRTYADYVRDEIFLPLGMNDSWLSLSSAAYEKYSREHRLAAMIDTAKSPPDRSNANQGIPDKLEAAQVHPGGSGRGPIRELGRFYEMLLGGGEKILSSDSVTQITSPQRVGMYDHTFKHVMDWGLGFILNLQSGDVAKMPYGYGTSASRRTFGHSGAQSSCGFCDPEHRLIVCWVCNGMSGDERHQLRQLAINNAIYQDLKIS